MPARHRPNPERLLRLLWRETLEQPRQRGPKAALAVGAVVDAGIAIADAEGIDALTIRRLASELNVATMSIYTYVSGKSELLPLMLDALHGELDRCQPHSRFWRDQLSAVAHDNLAFFKKHPWVPTLSLGRPPLGPGTMAKYEYELGALDGIGLSDVEMDSALTYLLDFVATCAQREWAETQVRQDSGMSDDAWWAANSQLFSLAFDSEKYPTAVRVGANAGEALGGAYSASHAWEFGLERVLDSLALMIGTRNAGRE